MGSPLRGHRPDVWNPVNRRTSLSPCGRPSSSLHCHCRSSASHPTQSRPVSCRTYCCPGPLTRPTCYLPYCLTRQSHHPNRRTVSVPTENCRLQVRCWQPAVLPMASCRPPRNSFATPCVSYPRRGCSPPADLSLGQHHPALMQSLLHHAR